MGGWWGGERGVGRGGGGENNPFLSLNHLSLALCAQGNMEVSKHFRLDSLAAIRLVGIATCSSSPISWPPKSSVISSTAKRIFT